MKRMTGLVLLAALAVGCGGGNSTDSQPTVPSTEQFDKKTMPPGKPMAPPQPKGGGGGAKPG